MVRLKGFIYAKEKRCKPISIPYGAIKSTLTYSERTYLQQISIPYGAIKRGLCL